MTGPETSDENERSGAAADGTLTVRRQFDAPPERVFDAWVDPDSAREWLFTSPASESTRVEMDAQVGGEYAITDRRDGEEFRAVGEYREVDRPNRLVFTFAMPQFSPESDRVVVEFEPEGGGCLMTVTQEGHSWPDEHAADYRHESEEGWTEMFDALATRVDA